MEFNAVSYTSAALGVYVQAKYSTIGEVKFLTSTSTFTNTATAECSGAMVVSAALTTSTGAISLTAGTTLTTTQQRSEPTLKIRVAEAKKQNASQN